MTMFLFEDFSEPILNRIIFYLNFTDLARMAEAVPWLKKYILKDLRLKYFLQRVVLTEFNRSQEDILLNYGRITIFDIRSILRYLRLFGGSMEMIVFRNDRVFEQDSLKVFEYIHKYAINIKRLHLEKVVYDLMRNEALVFKNVTCLCFSNCVISKSLCNLQFHFPNITAIRLYGENRIEDINNFIKEYPLISSISLNDLSVKSKYVAILKNLNSQMIVEYNVPFFFYG